MKNNTYDEIVLAEETKKCLLCNNASCDKACPYGLEISHIIRSYYFDNKTGAANRIPYTSTELPCLTCDAKPCQTACVKGKVNTPVLISGIMEKLSLQEKTDENTSHFAGQIKPENVDLSIDFCGVTCENPFFLSSSVVGSNYEMVAKAFDMGWAGVAFKTIGTFVPEEVSPRFDVLRKENGPFLGFKNIEQISDHSLEDNLGFLKKLKEDFPSKIIIASIMGQSDEEWTYLAKIVTEARADIIECNFSCPHMAADGMGSDVGQNPELVSSYTKAVRKGTHLPILAKMTPNIGNMEIPALVAMEAGADGIAAINTIKSIVNVNTETFVSGPEVQGKTSVGGYSGRAVKPIALHFIYSLKNNKRFSLVPVSGMGGIETWQDALEFISLGCENIQVTTSVMEYGYRVIEDMIEGMKLYLSSHGYKSITEIVGKALPKIVPAQELKRDDICYPKFDRSKCVGCGRCYLSCYDGGHQAIVQKTDSGQPILDPQKCVGCHLCLKVCPVQAISEGKRVEKKK